MRWRRINCLTLFVIISCIRSMKGNWGLSFKKKKKKKLNLRSVSVRSGVKIIHLHSRDWPFVPTTEASILWPAHSSQIDSTQLTAGSSSLPKPQTKDRFSPAFSYGALIRPQQPQITAAKCNVLPSLLHCFMLGLGVGGRFGLSLWFWNEVIKRDIYCSFLGLLRTI